MFASLGRAAILFSLCLSVVSGQAEDPFADLADVFPAFTQFGDLTVSWPSGAVISGTVNSSTELTPSATAGQPIFKLTPFTEDASPINPLKEGQLFTLAMIDPDAPSRETPTLKEILHALITGITVTESEGTYTLSAGTPVSPYIGPGPPAGSGLHRYIMLLFVQPDATVDAGNFNGQNRMNFNVRQFANNNGFGAPVAGAYFRAQNAQNPGAPAPIVGGDLVIDNGELPSRNPGETLSFPPLTYNGTLTVSAGFPGATITTTRRNGTSITPTSPPVNNITETGTPVVTGNGEAEETRELEIPDLSGLGGGAGMEKEIVGKTVLASFALGVAAIAAFML